MHFFIIFDSFCPARLAFWDSEGGNVLIRFKSDAIIPWVLCIFVKKLFYTDDVWCVCRKWVIEIVKVVFLENLLFSLSAAHSWGRGVGALGPPEFRFGMDGGKKFPLWLGFCAFSSKSKFFLFSIDGGV